MTELENYYLKQDEPIQSCLLALKAIVLNLDSEIIHVRKYQIPFFYYRDMKLAFLWVTKKKLMIGFVKDRRLQPMVVDVKRRKDNIQTLIIDPDADIPIEEIRRRLRGLMAIYEEIKSANH